MKSIKSHLMALALGLVVAGSAIAQTPRDGATTVPKTNPGSVPSAPAPTAPRTPTTTRPAELPHRADTLVSNGSHRAPEVAPAPGNTGISKEQWKARKAQMKANRKARKAQEKAERKREHAEFKRDHEAWKAEKKASKSHGKDD